METFTGIIDWIKAIDAELLVLINSWNSPFLDELMWLLTGKLIWFPLYLFLFYLVYKNTSIRIFIAYALIGFALVGLADFIATHGFKYNIARYRPSHNLNLKDLLHFYEIRTGEFYQGGQYGFVSGHATNSTAIALYFGLMLRKYYKHILSLLLLWALIVCYTRMYLGVHYPTDIIGGILLGSILSTLAFTFFKWISKKIERDNKIKLQE